MRRNFLLILFVLLLLGGCKKDKDVHVAKVQAETPDVTTTANRATISGTYSYASTLKSVVIAYGKDASLSSPQKATAEHTRDSYSVTINNLDPSTKYYYYCIFDTGYGAAESEQESFTTQSGGGGGGGGTIDGHEYVDLGLPSGLLWATCNVGADSPEDYGDYFAWGETEVKSAYNWSTYKWCNNSEWPYDFTKYNTQSNYGTVDNKTVLDPEDDAAHVNWGGVWRMPTREEMQELVDNCTWTWTAQGGKNGYRVTGPNGNSIFLPAAGYYGVDGLINAGIYGDYWSSSLSGIPCNAFFLYFVGMNPNGTRYEGQSVRPVCPSQSVSAPTVTTSSVSNIIQTTATCGGNVTSDGGAAVTARGVCWSTSQNPTVSDSHTADGSGTGSFTSSITGLTANTTYYVRAYATNSAGTSYGEQKSFTTQSIDMPTVTTSPVTDITQTTATCGGNVTSDGGAAVTARGVCWSTSQNPTVNNNHTTDGGGTGSFTSSITGLTVNTTYYVRAYATNSAGTSYGEQKSFTTQSGGGQTQTFTVNGVTFEMVAVEGGTFTMGGTSEQGSDTYDNEFPTHSVTLGDYYMGEFEVTQKLWVAVMGSNPSCFNGSNLPVEQVSWNDCQEFITKLNGLTGKNFRLPTEAEWEYAARGGNMSGGYKYSGSNSIGEVAWYDDNSGSKTHAVGTKSPNELGIYDMSGNVFEWCQDWYGGYSSSSQTNPQGPSSGSLRVSRGGSWDYIARDCRVSIRGNYAPDGRSDCLGFRLVVSQ